MKVVISSGYGAGWSTWNDPMLAFDERIIKAIEEGIYRRDLKALCIECGYDNPYMGGYEGLEVVDIPEGQKFRIKEYDGNESIELYNDSEWITAHGEYYQE